MNEKVSKIINLIFTSIFIVISVTSTDIPLAYVVLFSGITSVGLFSKCKWEYMSEKEIKTSLFLNELRSPILVLGLLLVYIDFLHINIMLLTIVIYDISTEIFLKKVRGSALSLNLCNNKRHNIIYEGKSDLN
ncbi:hypothetical protein RI065_05180 [Mycoplasmatota bacterium zrk1]